MPERISGAIYQTNSYKASWCSLDSIDELAFHNTSSFLDPAVFSSLNSSRQVLAVHKSNELRAVIPFSSSDIGIKAAMSSPISYAQGVQYLPKHMEIQENKKLVENTRVWEAVVSLLISQGVKKIDLDLGYKDLDVRPIIWSLESAGFDALATPRYSAILSDLTQRSSVEILQDFRSVRRQEFNRANHERSRIQVTDINDPGLTINRFEQVLSKYEPIGQNIRLELEAVDRAISDSVMKVRRFETWTGGVHFTGQIIGPNDANLVLNFTSTRCSEINLSTYATVVEILSAKAKGINTFDFNGANSPHRGDDKHSYGAKLALFLNVKATRK